MQSVNIYPQLATWKQSKDGLCPLIIRVDIDGKKAGTFALKRKLSPDDWDIALKKVRPGITNEGVINSLIRAKISELDAQYTKMQMYGTGITKAQVKQTTLNSRSNHDFYAFCTEQIAAAADSPSNKKHNRKHMNKLKRFAPSLSFGDLNYNFFQGYENWLRNKQNNAQNTIWADFKFIRHMVKVAISIGGYVAKNPLTDYPFPKLEETIPLYLEWDEVLKIEREMEENDALAPRLKSVAYTFLLQCFAGFRFSDASVFKWDKYVISTDKGERLLLATEKTGSIVSIGFTSHIRRAAEYLRDNPMPAISNQDYNRQLKIIAGIIRLKKQIASHAGRHTFGMRCAELGMSIDDVMKLMGHRKRETTAIYYKIKDSRLDEAMQVWEQ